MATRPSADVTRERILDAALEVFAALSFEGASTRAIATKAGVTQPLLNYHFSSKDELWRAAVDRLFITLSETMGERVAGLRGVDEVTSLKLLVREFVYFSARNPELHRIITSESKSDSARMDWLVDTHVQPLYDSLAATFARLSDRGVLPRIAPAHLYYILTGAAPTLFVLAPEARRLTGMDPFADDVIEAHADAVITLLFGKD